MNTYNWTISALDCKVDENNLKDVIQTIHWRYRATNENDITAETYGAQVVGSPNPEDFTPYNEITKEQIVSWLEASMDVEEMKDNLDNQINLIINPVNVVLPPPFEN
jgi:beta-glucanase (GH16 family)